jgi:hypothetical protein
VRATFQRPLQTILTSSGHPPRLAAEGLELRATENYFPDETVKAVFGDQYRGLQPYERLKDVTPRWGKSENWKLAAAWPLDAVEVTDLGKFLEAL